MIPNSSEKSFLYMTPEVTSTPLQTPQKTSRPSLGLRERVLTLPMTTPVIKQTQILTPVPMNSQIKPHPELRSHNNPGLKEVPVDVDSPRVTGSRKQLEK